MMLNQTLLSLLDEIKTEMQLAKVWQALPPKPDVFLSEQPFALDTMSPYEWLQWIFLPRMEAIIESKGTIPRNFALYPYFEEALKKEETAKRLLPLIQRLDECVKA